MKMAEKPKSKPSLGDSEPFKVVVGQKTYVLQKTVEAAMAVETAFGSVADALRAIAKCNRQSMATVLIICWDKSRYKDRNVQALTETLFSMPFTECVEIATKIGEYLNLMNNGFQPFDDASATPDEGDEGNG
jgi:hypothetical protein